MNKNNAIIDVSGLSVSFSRSRALFSSVVKNKINVLDDINFSVTSGQCLGVVGESGSGKTTLAKALLGMVPISEGNVKYRNDIDKQHDIQFIFQDPLAALNPKMTVEQLITEPLDYLQNKDSAEIRLERLNTIMEQVGLDFSQRQRYAHEFSGGQCQRIGIARAMITQPKILICDEPVSALDVSVRAQIINLLKTLQQQLDLTLIFIAHDLSLVRYISDELLVLYQGKLMESGSTNVIFSRPRHPYTDSLIRAEPKPDPQLEKQRLSHEVRDTGMTNGTQDDMSKQGCVYAPRCLLRQKQCLELTPQLEKSSPTSQVACFFPLDTRTAV